jgi:hypothetical protein
MAAKKTNPHRNRRKSARRTAALKAHRRRTKAATPHANRR